MTDLPEQSEPTDPTDHPAHNLPSPSGALSQDGGSVGRFILGTAKVYGQLASDFVSQAQGKKLQNGEYK